MAGGGYGGCCSGGDISEHYCNGLHSGSKDGGDNENSGGCDHSGNKSSDNPNNNCDRVSDGVKQSCFM